MPIQPIYLKTGPNWPNWQCCLAGSFKRAPRILIFAIAMGAEYLSYVKSIAPFAPTFYGYITSVLASVYCFVTKSLMKNHLINHLTHIKVLWKCNFKNDSAPLQKIFFQERVGPKFKLNQNSQASNNAIVCTFYRIFLDRRWQGGHKYEEK